VIQIDKQQIQS